MRGGGSLNSLHQRLLAATVKISIEDAQGKSSGTGTIVDTRSGEALILTCGHIFRSSGGKGPITVTTFQVGANGAMPGASYRGHLIDFDLERDLALVSMRPKTPVQAVAIADPGSTRLSPHAPVTSVGCDHGQNPTTVDSHVTSIDRYQGTPNVEVAGAPIEGRSGGGLFNAQGQLVGVCYAADPQANEGLYASLPSIYAKLDSLNLSTIYRGNFAASQQIAQAAPGANTLRESLSQSPFAVRGQEPDPPNLVTKPSPITLPTSLAAVLPAVVAPADARMSPSEQAALEEISRRGIHSEVICIIRPQHPGGKSEVITISNASPAFVQALASPRGIQPPVSTARR